MSDIQRMAGTFESPVTDGEYAVIEGEAPVSEMRDYAMDVNQYTHGHGRFSATFGGYKPCHDAEQIIAAAAYDPEADLDNTPTRSSAPTVPATPSNGIRSLNSPT